MVLYKAKLTLGGLVMNSSEVWMDTEYIDITINKKRLYPIFKRFMDILFVSIAILGLSPLLLFLFILVKITSRGPAIYKHKRIGKNGKEIYLYKFRTMVRDADNFDKYFTKEQLKRFKENYKIEDDPRITKVGKILRKSSLDELPQLFNIIKGEMSLIGPRPVVEEELAYFKENKEVVLSILPGLTGWWACNGRSCTSYRDRVQLETYYVTNMSMKLDIKCFFKTIVTVLKKEGAK